MTKSIFAYQAAQISSCFHGALEESIQDRIVQLVIQYLPKVAEPPQALKHLQGYCQKPILNTSLVGIIFYYLPTSHLWQLSRENVNQLDACTTPLWELLHSEELDSSYWRRRCEERGYHIHARVGPGLCYERYRDLFFTYSGCF